MVNKYLEFKEMPFGVNRKTKIFHILSVSRDSNPYLGEILWFNHWRKYCFSPVVPTVFDSNCLMEIVLFLNKLNKKT